MKNNTPIAVTSRSFSKHPILRSELFQLYSDVRFNDEGVSLSGDKLIRFAKGRIKLITALEKIDETFLSALPELEVISKYGVGTDMLDKEALIKHGIRLGWAPGVNKRSVTELTIAFILSFLRNITTACRETSTGVWKNRKGRQLSGKTVGIIGCGNIGKDLAVILKAFGCRILVYDIIDYREFYATHHISPVSLETLLSESDFVTLHIPLDNSTRNILSADKLHLMRPDAILINTARGHLVDEIALKQMLVEGEIAGAAFDVFATEPPDDLSLLELDNFLATPHIGGSTEESILAMGRAAIFGLDNNRIPSSDFPPSR